MRSDILGLLGNQTLSKNQSNSDSKIPRILGQGEERRLKEFEKSPLCHSCLCRVTIHTFQVLDH